MDGREAKRSTVDDSVERRDVPAAGWYQIRNPIRFGLTYYVFELCKHLPPIAKNPVYRAFGVEIGSGSVLAPAVVVDPFFPEKITIGEGSLIGWGTKLLTHEGYTDEWHVGPVEIGDDVTLGHGSSTRPGVTIGDGATVAAHSFVNRDVAPGERVGGVPIEPLSGDE
ncbi:MULTISPECIES: acyltransferase [Halomicrobium]|uniref:Hexapaptide repeat-containing transferase n=2 Tax=Halomicrobium mukohataei TaxID=57705 RepID=C7P3X5_HALMD|nr:MULTISPECIES: acyltransferase [Halomicrobium]ACV47797.1 hexapaptide repeat-containing transferase [Halomicrobium mukohataei DSM 12286]QCD66246.1 acyltransferase [Halomicrobium mukohataei]QFR21052.1 acyltransferase [Halomicrobium sp. ZPS1]